MTGHAVSLTFLRPRLAVSLGQPVRGVRGATGGAGQARHPVWRQGYSNCLIWLLFYRQPLSRGHAGLVAPPTAPRTRARRRWGVLDEVSWAYWSPVEEPGPDAGAENFVAIWPVLDVQQVRPVLQQSGDRTLLQCICIGLADYAAENDQDGSGWRQRGDPRFDGASSTVQVIFETILQR